jgi:hypothetical protein
MALGVTGLSTEDALTHLLNFVWPNIFETSPHVINAVLEAIEGLRLAIGPAYILQYTIQVLRFASTIQLLLINKSMAHELTWNWCALQRVCSIQHARCAISIGRSTTTSTLAAKMHWLHRSHRFPTRIVAMKWTCSYKPLTATSGASSPPSQQQTATTWTNFERSKWPTRKKYNNQFLYSSRVLRSEWCCCFIAHHCITA